MKSYENIKYSNVSRHYEAQKVITAMYILLPIELHATTTRSHSNRAHILYKTHTASIFNSY